LTSYGNPARNLSIKGGPVPTGPSSFFEVLQK
jgi:hypothetical protein